MNAIEYLKRIPRSWLPVSVVRGIKPPSNSELYRWLKNSSVAINGMRPKPSEEITFPIRELVFFPSGKRRTTIIREEKWKQ